MNRVLLSLVFGWLVALVLLFFAGKAGLRLNTSASVPRGLYWLSQQQAVRGDYVAVCPPRAPIFDLAKERGYFGQGRCAGGYSELIKVFAAGAGDRVGIDDSGVRIGERQWPSSAPRSTDAAGRLLPRLTVLESTLDGESVLVMSQDCALGFDARYFGPLSRSAIVGIAVPLITW